MSRLLKFSAIITPSIFSGGVPSAAQSSLVASAFANPADGSTPTTLTGTWRKANSSILPNKIWTLVIKNNARVSVTGVLTTDDADIETTTGIANITAYIYDEDGYPVVGVPSASMVLSSTGTGNTITPVDSVTDGDGRFRWTFSSTSAATKTISLAACGQTQTDTVEVVVGTQGLLTAIFQSDFGTATGTGSSAYLDGGAWDRIGGFGQEVVASTGLDFPSTNVCRFDANYANSGFCLTQADTAALAVGVTRYHRLYARMTFPDELVGNGDHPWQDGNAVGDCNYIIGVHYGSDDSPTHAGDWRLGVIIIEDSGSIYFDNGPWLTKGVTYRIEYAVERIDTSTYNFDIRVYNSADTLLYTSVDFPATYGGGTLATRGPYDLKAAQEASPGDFFNCGTNDFETAGNDWWDQTPYDGVFTYGYQGCFAICEDQGWIGTYGSVSGE